MENIKELMEQYKSNFARLEKVSKEQTKAEQDKRTKETEQSENFYNLQDKKINGEEYTRRHEEIKKEIEKAKEKSEVLLIEKKLLQDNENIIIDKIIIDIFKNIIKKYEGKNIGEQTTRKMDEEIKNYISDLFNDKYITIYQYNEWRNTTPNQFIDLYGAEYNFSNYQKKLNISITSHYNERNDYKQKIYIKDGYFLLNEYSKQEQREEDNKKNIERIENTETIQDTKKKAKEIYKAYKKKIETLERLRKQQEQTEKDFKKEIQTNQETYFHNLFNYFYR